MAQLCLCPNETTLVTETIMRALLSEVINGNFEGAGEIHISFGDAVHRTSIPFHTAGLGGGEEKRSPCHFA